MTYLGNIQRHERHVGLKDWIIRYHNQIREERQKEEPNEFLIEKLEKDIKEAREELRNEFNDDFKGPY